MTRATAGSLGHCLCDDTMTIVDANDAFAEILRQPVVALRGQNVLVLTHQDDRTLNKERLSKARGDEQPFSIRKRYITPDGPVWVRNHVTRDGAAGQAPQFVATTERIETILPQDRLDAAVRAGEGMLRRRRLREQRLGPAAKEARFDLLLDLFVNEAKGRSVSISSACLATNRPATTNLRHLHSLEETGLIVRESDPERNRRYFAKLSPDFRNRLINYLRECEEPSLLM